MKRRQLLVTATGGGTALIAGCSGEESDDSATTQKETDTPAGETTNERLRAAAEEMESAESKINTESDKFTDSSLDSGQGVSIQTATILSELDAASTELDAAEQGATSEQQDAINAARNWISFARATTEFLGLFADGYNEFTTANTYFESERYSDATGTLDTAQENFESADSQLTIVQDRQESLTEMDHEAFENITLSTTPADIEQLESILETLIPFIGGYRQMTLGFEDFIIALESLENRDYADAESEYRDAEDHFTSAETRIRGLEESAPPSLRNSVIELTSIAGTLKESAGHYATGSEYYANGDTRAGDQEFKKGEKALEKYNSEN